MAEVAQVSKADVHQVHSPGGLVRHRIDALQGIGEIRRVEMPPQTTRSNAQKGAVAGLLAGGIASTGNVVEVATVESNKDVPGAGAETFDEIRAVQKPPPTKVSAEQSFEARTLELASAASGVGGADAGFLAGGIERIGKAAKVTTVVSDEDVQGTGAETFSEIRFVQTPSQTKMSTEQRHEERTLEPNPIASGVGGTVTVVAGGADVGILAGGMERIGNVAKVTTAKALSVVTNKDVQVATLSTLGGAVVVGTSGAATGLVTGGAIGAAVGVVPAIFTLGLSIPFCAIVGGGCGLAVGTAVGGTTGAMAGAGGYCAFTKHESIRNSFGAMTQRACISVESIRGRLEWH